MDQLHTNELPADQQLDLHANEIMQVLAEAMRLEKLEFDESNECVFTINNQIPIVAYFDASNTNTIILNIALGYLPQNNNLTQLLTDMMAGNYCWSLTEGGTLGVDKSCGMITLSYLIPLPMPEKGQIIDIVSKLVSVADYWMKKIGLAQHDDSGDTARGDMPLMRV